MPYAFQPGDATIRAALRRIASERLAKALADLGADDRPRAERVHAARKSIKKLRAMLRLFAPGLKTYRAENKALRDIARRLAPLRDADVTGALLADLAAEAALPVPKAATSVAPPAPQDADRRIAAALSGLSAAAVRAKGWKPQGQGFDALAVGLATSWDRGRKALKQARDQGTAEAIHALRKRLKDHGYHARLLRAIWPEAVALHLDAAAALGEALGRHQDFAMLEQRLGNQADLRPLIALAREHRGAILAEALPAAARLYAEPGAALASRWRLWWQCADPALPRI